MVKQGADAGPVTVVNLLQIDAEKVDSFIACRPQLAELMRKQPGFRSFRLLRALSSDSQLQLVNGDQLQLVNIAEWDSAETLCTATAQPNFQARVTAAVEKFEVTAHPGLYSVADEGVAPC